MKKIIFFTFLLLLFITMIFWKNEEVNNNNKVINISNPIVINENTIQNEIKVIEQFDYINDFYIKKVWNITPQEQNFIIPHKMLQSIWGYILYTDIDKLDRSEIILFLVLLNNNTIISWNEYILLKDYYNELKDYYINKYLYNKQGIIFKFSKQDMLDNIIKQNRNYKDFISMKVSLLDNPKIDNLTNKILLWSGYYTTDNNPDTLYYDFGYDDDAIKKYNDATILWLNSDLVCMLYKDNLYQYKNDLKNISTYFVEISKDIKTYKAFKKWDIYTWKIAVFTSHLSYLLEYWNHYCWTNETDLTPYENIITQLNYISKYIYRWMNEYNDDYTQSKISRISKILHNSFK